MFFLTRSPKVALEVPVPILIGCHFQFGALKKGHHADHLFRPRGRHEVVRTREGFLKGPMWSRPLRDLRPTGDKNTTSIKNIILPKDVGCIFDDFR